jgi:hypothetical protein
MENQKAITRTTSYRPGQLDRIKRFIDPNRFGQFSQFVQDAVDAHLDKLEGKEETNQPKPIERSA